MSNTHKLKATLLHDWVMLATFKVGESEVEQLAAARVDPTGEGRSDVQLTQDKMEALDGPGCRACGIEWTVGYGSECGGRMKMPALVTQHTVDRPEVQSKIVLPNGKRSGETGPGLYIPEQ